MSADYKELHADERQSSFEAERLLDSTNEQPVVHQGIGSQHLHLRILYVIIAGLLVLVTVLSWLLVKIRGNNPQLALWCKHSH